MDVVTLGESMALLTPTDVGHMRYATNFTCRVAGAESNVAVGLARLGHKAGWISRLGNDEFGKKILHFIRGEGVDISEVKLDDTALTGIYFKEMKAEDEIHVQYYRTDSAASKMSTEDVNESYIKHAKFLHITGITPALSTSCYETIIRAIEIARKHQVKVVFDPNIRHKIWNGNQAKSVLLEIVAKSDIVLPGLSEAEFLFGDKELETLAQEIYNYGASIVAIKCGANGVYYLSEAESGMVAGIPIKNVVDPVGAGDGFAAGFLSGLLDELSLKAAIERGNAVGALATRVHGDVEGYPERDQLLSFISNKDIKDVSR